MTIRQATEADIDDILRLLRQIYRLHAALRPDLFAGQRRLTKYNAEELTALIADSERRPLLVACSADGELLAYAMCAIERNADGLATLYLDDLCVDERHRGAHIGQELFGHVTELARQRGCYNLTLHVWHGNDAAAAFYEAMGLTEQYRCLELRL